MGTVLENVRIIDASTVLAAPGAATLLADFGAEVIKIEQPGSGDPVRRYPPQIQGQSLGSKVTNRNKFSVTLDLRQDKGQEIFRQLVAKADVVVVNYRLSTLKNWHLDYPELATVNPAVVMLHLTGFGRTGPYADWPGFARVAEAFTGLTYMSGYPDRGPMFAGYAIGDGIGSVYGAFSILLALMYRQRTGEGQLIDLALYEPIMRMLDALYVGYDQTHEIPQRVGTINPGVAPSDIYETRDHQWVVLPASTPTMFARLCEAMGHPELVADPRFDTNLHRITYRAELDQYVVDYIGSLTLAEVLATCRERDIAAGPVNNVQKVMEDVHVQSRESIVSVFDENLGTSIRMQGVFPKLTKSPGAIRWAGHEPGQDNEAVYQGLLGLRREELAALRVAHVI